ncbi:hypothetical protein SDC9_131987 [bioreactor metagenome]|uniref:Uncharacterized protein n=1 Tax=bioreactor metagenome TaxID=1076179 RepID=A0A645D6M9_9ZZZZ
MSFPPEKESKTSINNAKAHPELGCKKRCVGFCNGHCVKNTLNKEIMGRMENSGSPEATGFQANPPRDETHGGDGNGKKYQRQNDRFAVIISTK